MWRQLAQRTQRIAQRRIHSYQDWLAGPQPIASFHTSQLSSYSDDLRTSFGFQTIREEEKEGMVRGVFASVAPSYDVMNDVMSVGLHRVWKDRLVSKLKPGPATQHLDVAGGTGDVAFRVLSAIRSAELSSVKPVQKDASVVVLDINPNMLQVGKARAEKAALDASRLTWIEGNAEELPIADATFDSYTIAFGIRNCTHIDKVLSEAYRVLKPGGQLMVLEFSTVEVEVLRQFYDMYSFAVIPAMGQAIAGDRDSYQYLVESIRKFPQQDVFAGMLEDAGFQHVEYENLTAGVCAIHSGFKF